jgi:integrin alpha 7
LFVGAPFFHLFGDELTEFGGGAVYLYLNGPEGLSGQPEIRLTGSRKSESRFGFSIANAGDLNNDGLADVIIGAPYDGKGKIFVYMGRKAKLTHVPDQIISAEDLPFKNIRTFGYSLGGGIDMDMNNFTDIVVGAYESDAIIVVRSRPVIDIETWFGKKPDSIRPDMAGCEGDVYSPEVCFIIESCFLIKNFPPNIETTHIRYRLDAEIFPGGFGRKVSRIRFGDNRSNSSHSSEKIVAVERTSLTG